MLTVATKLPDDLARVFLFEVEQRGTTKSRLARDLIERGLAGSDSWFSGEGPKPEPVAVASVPQKPSSASPRPKQCPKHPDAGKAISSGRTYCDAPLCMFEYKR